MEFLWGPPLTPYFYVHQVQIHYVTPRPLLLIYIVLQNIILCLLIGSHDLILVHPNLLEVMPPHTHTYTHTLGRSKGSQTKGK